MATTALAIPAWREWMRSAVLFTALTLVATWPQVMQPAGVLPHRDSWFNLWRVAWLPHQLATDPVRLFDANIYYPARHTLAYSDAILVPALLGAPLRWAGVPTPYVHTLLVMASFVFAAMGAWALVRTLTGSGAGGILAGLILAYTPYRFDHYMHLELLWSGWMPFALLALQRVIDEGRARVGLVFGLLVAAQTLSCIYYGVFFVTVLIAVIAVQAYGVHGRPLRHIALSLACGVVLAGALTLPYLSPYQAVRADVGERSEGEAVLYSAGPRHYLSATPENLIYGRVADRTGRPEKRLFPGVVAGLLVLAALWPPLDRRRVGYAIALVVAVDLSFGPNGLLFDWLREHAVPYRGLRAPARAGGVALVFVAVLAGIGWARLERIFRALPRMRVISMLVLCAAALEYASMPLRLVRADTRPPEVYQWLASRPSGVIVEFPMPDEHGLPLHDAEFEYASTFHWHSLVNGYSGNVPASYIDTLRQVHPFPHERGMQRLRSLGVRYVVVHERLFGRDAYRSATAALDRYHDLVRHGPFGTDGDHSFVYEFSPARHE
jgi:hypothetical protein